MISWTIITSAVHRTIVIRAAAVRHSVPVVRMGAEVVPLGGVVPSVAQRTEALDRIRRLLGVPAWGLLPVPSSAIIAGTG